MLFLLFGVFKMDEVYIKHSKKETSKFKVKLVNYLFGILNKRLVKASKKDLFIKLNTD